jgi:FtsH-binding integral membrane protein
MNSYDYFFLSVFKALFITALVFITAIVLMLNVVMLFDSQSYISAACLTVFGLPLSAVILFFIWELIDGDN